MALGPWTLLCVGLGVEGHVCAVWRNFRPRAGGNFLLVRAIDVGNEDVVAACVCDFALPGVNEQGKCDAEKYRNNKLLHVLGALTLGKRPFLIRRFKFFPSTDIR